MSNQNLLLLLALQKYCIIIIIIIEYFNSITTRAAFKRNSHTNLGPNVLEARYLCKYVNKASEKGLNSQPWSPLLSRKDDKIKSLDTEGKRNIVNFLNITQYLRFKLQFKVFTVAKTFDVKVFCVCWLFCRVWTTKMEAADGKWTMKMFFCFFFEIFVLLFGYSFITQTSFRPWKLFMF